jgi:Transposase DDE domain/Transposase domain (DUF772)
MMHWDVPIALSAQESKVAKRLHRIGKFYVFLREIRHELFEARFEAELAKAYKKPRGTAPIPPALLAMVTLLQAYDHVGDADAVVTASMDKRWQLVLGTLGEEAAPFSQGALVAFRDRLMTQELDRKLVSRTVELARASGKFGWQHLQAALDSSPLIGAGRVEDTWNLLGRVMSQLVVLASQVTGLSQEVIRQKAGVTLLGHSSLKAALDCDWDAPQARQEGLQRLVEEAEALVRWVHQHSTAATQEPPLCDALADLARIMTQDLEPDPSGGAKRLRRGTVRDRLTSLGDRDMRHGRKSKAHPFTGYKRHVLTLLDSNLVVDAVAQPANQPEYEALATLWPSLAAHGQVQSLSIDRAYLSSPLIGVLKSQGIAIIAKPWPLRNQGRFTKEAFEFRLDRHEVTCPAGMTVSLRESGRRAQFPVATCGRCVLQANCTTSARGRTLSVHPQEALLIELRATRRTAQGRQALRQRTGVEHTLARIDQLQGKRARYKGTRKNTFDLRRMAAVNNLQHIHRVQALERAA